MNKYTHFPFFIDIQNKNVLIVGAGKIAERRIKTLLNFDVNITVIAPNATDDIIKLNQNKQIKYFKRQYQDSDLENSDIAVVATNNRDLNRQIGEKAKIKGIFVSVADKKEECNFYFPAIIPHGETIMGIIGNGKDHHLVSKTADEIRRLYKSEN